MRCIGKWEVSGTSKQIYPLQKWCACSRCLGLEATVASNYKTLSECLFLPYSKKPSQGAAYYTNDTNVVLDAAGPSSVSPGMNAVSYMALSI